MGRLRSRRWCKLSRHANLPGPPPPYPGGGWCLKRQGGHMQNPFITAPRLAVLIDAENISAAYTDGVLIVIGLLGPPINCCVSGVSAFITAALDAPPVGLP